MRFFLFLMFLTVSIFARPALAGDALEPLRSVDPAETLLEEKKGPETLEDYTTIYYDSCVAANTDPTMNEYMQTQCGCTTAEMSKFMTVKDMQFLLKTGKESNFQMGRVMMLAYIPCMYTSVYNIIFDGCYFNETTRKLLRKDKKVCQCYAHAMGDYVATQGPNIVPGFERNTFRSADSVPNPLGFIISQRYFANTSAAEYERCVAVVEKGLGQ